MSKRKYNIDNMIDDNNFDEVHKKIFIEKQIEQTNIDTDIYKHPYVKEHKSHDISQKIKDEWNNSTIKTYSTINCKFGKTKYDIEFDRKKSKYNNLFI